MLAPGYALALALAVTAPLLAPGYLLLRDAVSTPRSYLTDAALGLTEAAPRALPQDFAVAVASRVVDGGLIVKALLVLGLWLAGWGAARLADTVLPDAGVPGQLVAATVAIWNPYVAERLLQGHWSLLVGYGCLPWVAAAVLRLRTGTGGWWPLVLWLALAGLTPTGLLLATLVALVSIVAPAAGDAQAADGDTRRRAGAGRLPVAGVSLGVAVLAAAPWSVAAAVSGSLSEAATSPEAGVHAFAARAEPGLGTLGSLAGLGGIWNSEAVPLSRTTPFAVVATVALLAVLAAGLPVAARRPAAMPLLMLAVGAVLVPAALATEPGLAVVEAAVRAVPGLGVVRDGQKWVALAMPGYALAGAGAVITLRRWLPSSVTAAVACALVVATLPDLAWGVGGRVAPVRYPAGWAAAAAVIDADPRPVAVLPTGSMRDFGWAGDAPVLDPLPRWVRADVLGSGDLVIGGQTVPGEGSRAREVERLLLGGATAEELSRAGVGWLVLEKDGERGDAPDELLGLPAAYRDDTIAVYRVGGDQPAARNRGVAIAAHLVWLATLCAGLVGTAAGWVRAVRRRR